MSTSYTNVVTCLFEFPSGAILIQDHVKIGGLTIPGGAVEQDECIYGALRRELREELNVCLDSLKVQRCIERIHDDVETIEHRFIINVPGNFKWENMEPEKHNWIKPMGIAELNSYCGVRSDILKSVLGLGA